jgi:hypothetical protein
MNARLCRTWIGGERKHHSATVGLSASILIDGNRSAQKGRPPPGGEEARVVVYQPRGVGLIHTRHKPGDAHYTHETL